MSSGSFVWYFAYGSNMNPARLFDERMAGSGVRWGRRIAGWLDDWQLAFNKPWSRFEGAAVANIMRQPGARVYGTLNEIEPAGLEVLDRFEGVAGGHYARQIVRIGSSEGIVTATTYVSQYKLRDDLKPAHEYLAHLLAGRDLLPPDYVARLEAIPTITVAPEKQL